MDKDDAIRIRANFKYLVDNLRICDIQDYLFQRAVLDEDDMEELSTVSPTPRKAARKFLLMLPKKGPDSFKIFCDSLKVAKCDFIVEQLMKTDISTVAEEDVPDFSMTGETKLDELKRQLWVQTELLMRYRDDIAKLREKTKGTDEEKSSAMKTKFDQLENTMAEKGLTEDDVVEFLRDYMKAPKVRTLAQGNVGDVSYIDSIKFNKDQFMKEKSQRRRSAANIGTLTDAISRALGIDIIEYMIATQLNNEPHVATSKYAKTMRRAVHELSKKYDDIFKKFIQDLSIDELNGFQTLANVADELFREGPINWGRIVALYAFGGYVARYSVSSQDSDVINMIGEFLGFYVSKKLGDWIREHGGWDAFLEHFSEPSDEGSNLWHGLFITAMGLATLASVIASK
ncbi:hypothetical protein LSAT2_027704 [Lamellibrachia satsuma]|nr:hypothetical protein LSAT2_027704 [Lamellibrachia satsuma]